MSNRLTKELQDRENQKSSWSASFFLNFFVFFRFFLMKFDELSDFSSIFVSGGGLFFGFWSVLQWLSIGLVMVLVDCGGGWRRIFLDALFGEGSLRELSKSEEESGFVRR